MNAFLLACSDLTGTNAMGFVHTATPATIAFEVVVLLGVALTCFVLMRRVPNFWLKFVATASGVMIFEFFTAPMWRNEKLGPWGYVYHDVSWILTLGWTALILGTTSLAGALLPGRGEGARYALSLLLLLGLVLIAENVLVGLEIRRYAPEVQAILSGHTIGFIPIEALYYVPVFTALVVAFSRYWSFYIDDAALVPVVRTRWLRALGLTALAVVLFEVMVEPMVENRDFPGWSYFYRDVNLLLTGAWVLIIAIAGIVVQRFLPFRPLPQRFAAALLLIACLALPFESWLIHSEFRVYGPSAAANFSGIKTWLTGVPVEVVFAIPLYTGLMIGFIRYWEIVGDNNGFVRRGNVKQPPVAAVHGDEQVPVPTSDPMRSFWSLLMSALDTTGLGFKTLLLTAGVAIGSVQSFFVLAVLVICTAGIGLIPLLLLSYLVGVVVRGIWCPAWFQRHPILFGFLVLVVGSGVVVAVGILAYLIIVTFGLILLPVSLLSYGAGRGVLYFYPSLAVPGNNALEVEPGTNAREHERRTALTTYVRKAKADGVGLDDIIAAVYRAGWDPSDIERALKSGPSSAN